MRTGSIIALVFIMLGAVAGAALAAPPHIRSWGSLGSAPGEFTKSWGVAADEDGNVFVADVENHRMQKFSSTGDYLMRWGTFGFADTQFAYPHGIAVDASGFVFVAVTGGNCVSKYTNEGGFVSRWGTFGGGTANVWEPFGIAIDPDGNVVISEQSNHRIHVFTNEGAHVRMWGGTSPGTGPGQFNFPFGVAVDPANGDVYVADGGNHRIQKFTNTGTFLLQWGAQGTGNGQFEVPTAITVDHEGSVLVADLGDRIQKFTSTGTFVESWGGTGTGPSQFQDPGGIAFTPNGAMYVAEGGGNRVQQFVAEYEFVPSGEPQFLLAWGGTGGVNGRFDRPFGCATDASGNVYVADKMNYRVQKFDADGQFLTTWGSIGSLPGQFSLIAFIAVADNGTVYTTDADGRVQYFTSTGGYLGGWGSYGSGPGQMAEAEDLDFDSSGNLYIADRYNHRVQKFSPTGTLLGGWGTEGSAPGQFREPIGLAVDDSNQVYVAELVGRRVQKFDAAGNYLATIVGGGFGDPQVAGALGIGIDADQMLYVCDAGQLSIKKFTRTGEFVTRWGGIGSAGGKFRGPHDVAFGSDGVIYVTDQVNDRVQKFQELQAGVSVVTPGPASACLSTSNACTTLPVQISRTEATGMRGYSVALQLSANLELCAGPSSITEGVYLSSISGTSFHVIDHGSGSYTIDCAILGEPCGATAAGGTLFDVAVKKAPGPDGIGTVTVAGVVLRDCINGPIAAASGPAATITIDTSAPAAVALSAAQRKTGSVQPPAGTTDVLVSWTGQEPGSSVAVYRKGFGGYPQYDENGGAVPGIPATPDAALGAGWALSPVTTTGGADRSAARDFYYHVAFVTDACGNVSAVSNMTSGTLNYHLGDVHDGVAMCAGNNLVNTSDISALGANYGATVVVNGALECLDVGPTTTNTVDGRPTTDNQVQFEDLIMFAINYGQVSAPQDGPVAVAAEHNTLELEVPGLPDVGGTFVIELRASGAGDVQGMSVRLSYDPSVVEFLGVDAGELLNRQGVPSLALTGEAGVVDVALLGSGAALRGMGTLAEARFRVRAAGAPGISIASLTARNGENRAVPVAYAGGPVGVPPAGSRVPEATVLLAPSPNPSAGVTGLAFTLAREARVDLAVYGLDGRKVRTLVSETRAAGAYRLEWDGRDEGGRATHAGMYFVRMTTPDIRQARTLIRL